MKELKKSIIKNNYINIKDMTNEDFEILSQEGTNLFFDTESCPDFPVEIVKKYDLENVEYDTIEDFGTMNEGSILYELKKSKQLRAKIYVFMVGSNMTNRVYWGNTIDEFIKLIEDIDTFKVKNKKSIETFNIYVHNLQWDIEFIKYWLKDNNFNQIIMGHNLIERKKTQKQEHSFEIVENSATTHNARIQLDKRKVGKKTIMTSMLFIDSLKITPLSLKKISEDLIEIDDIYKKNSEIYKYNLIRNPEEYKPTTTEAFYQYCDIYILKEWYNQFIVKNYINEGIKPYTISQIAFDSIIEKSFNKDKMNGKYDHLMDKNGKIDNRRIYEEHFGLKVINMKSNILEYIKTSYKGGITTVGSKYKEIAKNNDFEINGVSIDITSSYPSQIVNKPLPYGTPTEIKEGKYCDCVLFGKKYDFHFITIGFDGWVSKNPNNQFGLPVKIKGLTDEEKKELNWTPNEIYPTNCIDFEFKGTNRIQLKDKKRAAKIDKLPYRYIITITNYEFEMWDKMFNFIHFKNGKMVQGVDFIDYISFQSETGYMKEGIEHFYRLKEEGTIEGNKSKVFNSKIIINSFYGKNCSKSERQQRFYNFENDLIRFQPITEDNKNEWFDSKLYAIQYGSAVTSWGRIQLMETIYKIGSENFVYADTDSLKIANITKNELVEICKNNSINLSLKKEDKQIGWWDFEFTFTDFKAIAQKKYMYKKEGNNEFVCKCSGLPGEIRKEITNKETFNLGSKFVKNGKNKVIGGYLLLPTEFTITDTTIL